jgi:hypothetical protein
MTELFVVIFVLASSYPIYQSGNKSLFTSYIFTAFLFLFSFITANTFYGEVVSILAKTSILYILWRVSVEYLCLRDLKAKHKK